MNRIVFSILSLFILCAPSYSWITDFQGVPYTGISAFFTNTLPAGLDGVVISPPYKLFTGSLKPLAGEWVYDYQDRGDRFQRGCVAGFYGNGESFDGIAASLKSRGIKVYSRANVFFQQTGYNRSVWNAADFTDGQISQDHPLLLDIRRTDTANKVRAILQGLMKEPVEKWLVDLRDIPESLQDTYRDFLRQTMGDKVITLENTGGKGRLSPEYYWTLRLKYFSPAKPDFKGLLSAQKSSADTLHWIESTSFSVDNTATLAYMMLLKLPMVVPSGLLSQTHLSLIRFVQEFSAPRFEALSGNRLLVTGPGHVMAFNFSDQLSMWNIPPIDAPAGIYPSREGGGFLYSGNKPGIFLFPQVVASFSTRK